MKNKKHLNMFTIYATCICKKIFKIKSTKEKDINIDICSNCHPFYTGEQKIIHNIGRIGRFNKQFKKIF